MNMMSGKFPRKFGKYVLLKSLAKGGMGEIYVAAGGQIGGFEKLCVIKKVITEKADRSKANRFLDEAKVVLRLSHSCLVTTFDAGEVDGEFYIAMELIEGKDLREVWNRCVQTRERIPLDVALHVVREVARALSYVHGYGNLKLVHRDVAPPNILLAYVGDVKLTDFGLARSVLKQEHTAPGVVYGRAAYLAPEQARGEVADSRTDVYTLGVVLWELLTGQQFLQISGLDPATALAIVRHPKIVKPSSKAPWITADLDTVVMKALAPSREERYQSADEMRRALNEIIATIAPRAGADRINDFLENIYRDVIVEERNERDRFLQAAAGAPRAENDPASSSAGSPTLPSRPPGEDSRTQPRVKVAPRPTPRPPSRRPPVQGSGQAPPPGGAPRLPGLPPSPKPPDAVLMASAAAPARKHAVRAPAGAAPQPPPFDSSIGDGEELRARFIGRVVGGRYRIVAAIGEGGMGQVFSAEHVEIGKRAAIKVLNPSCSGRADLVERFRLEARAASKIGHPNIVDVTDFGTTEEGLVYYVMEQLDGIDLAEVLAQERRVDPERAVQISIQVCQALQAAHEQKIIHRDLKPENIFLSPRGAQGDAVKIIDFGLARSLQEAAVGKDGRPLTNPGTPIGTPEYMAPEQADGKPADERSDIYAVGAILYEMITGVPAFSGSFGDVLVKKSSQRPNLPHELKPDVSRELSDIVMTSMDPDPARRPQTMRELEYDLTRVLRGRGKAVAAFLGIEPDQHDTPTPVLGVGIYAGAATAAAGPDSGQPRRIVSLDKAAGPESKVRPPQLPLEVSDLTVPAATVFPDIEHEPSIPDATVEDLPTTAANRLWEPRAAPAAPVAPPPPVAAVPRSASPRPSPPFEGRGEVRPSAARPVGDPPAGDPRAPRATVAPAPVRPSAPAPFPVAGQAFLERHGLRQDGSKAEGGGHKTTAMIGIGLAVLAVVVTLLFR